MDQEKNISACDVSVDFARLLWESDCEAPHLVDLANRAHTELGTCTIADVARCLFLKLAETVDALKGKTPGAVVCGVKMRFESPTNELTVQGYLTPLEAFINRSLKSQFPGFAGVRVSTRYERVEVVQSELNPFLFGQGVRKPFEA